VFISFQGAIAAGAPRLFQWLDIPMEEMSTSVEAAMKE